MTNLQFVLGKIKPTDVPIDDLYTILEMSEVKSDIKRGGFLALMMYVYQYGVMMGKREERKKR